MFRKGSIQKAAIITMAAAVQIAAVAPLVSAADSVTFSDVPKSNVHYESIMKMKELGLIEGNKGKFLPYENITRGQVSVILTRALKLDTEAEAIAGKYKDVPADHGYAKPIAAMTGAGIFSGSNGYFHPYKKITREQMASVLVKAFKLDQLKADRVSLSDKKISSSHRGNVQVLANLGVTKETGDFRPFAPISREQFATMVARAMEASEDGEQKPVIAYESLPGEFIFDQTFVSNNGVLVNMLRTAVGTEHQLDITTVNSDGEKAEWSIKGDQWSLRALYGSDGKGKEVIYVFQPETNQLQGLDLSLKTRWEIKLGASDHVTDIDETDGSIRLKSGDKITVDGQRLKQEKENPAVRQIGDFEYRVDEEEATYQKIDTARNEVIWTKRVFDLEHEGENDKPIEVSSAFIDSEGNAYATVRFRGTVPQVVAVNSDGELLWKKHGSLDYKSEFGDIIHYQPYYLNSEEWENLKMILVNKKTGEFIGSYGPSGFHDLLQVTEKGKHLYVSGRDYVDVFNGKGEIAWSYKTPEGQDIYNKGFDNDNNYYMQIGAENYNRNEDGLILKYSEDGRLISKKKFDFPNFNRFIIDPTGRQHYQMDSEDIAEVYKYSE